MENVSVSKPMDNISNTHKIFCAKCQKEISETTINNVFKITMGLIMKHDFVPAEKTVYYHKKCL